MSHCGGNAADYDMCVFSVAIRGLEKEQEGLVKEQIEELMRRVACLEAEVLQLRKNQWSFGPLTEPVQVVGGYYQTGQPVMVNTTGAGIE